ncbi:MAG TPA: hypothetical protein VF773_13750 [Verrucomicrobiae bacterium]
MQRIEIICGLLTLTLLGCGTLRSGESLPKEIFLRANNDATRTYTLWETSIEALNREAMKVTLQGRFAFEDIKEKFPNNPELIEYLNEELDSVQVRKVLYEHRIAEMEEKMNPGDTIYLFELSEQSDPSKSPVYGDNSFAQMRRASGMLILNRKGKIIWREIEEANYPYYKEEAQYEYLERVLRRSE